MDPSGDHSRAAIAAAGRVRGGG